MCDDGTDSNLKQTDTITTSDNTNIIIASGINGDADLDNSVDCEDGNLATSSDTTDTGFLRKSEHRSSQKSESLSDQDGPNLDDETDTSEHHSSADDPIDQANTINLSEFPRSKDGGIVVYPDIHFHNKANTDKPDPSSLGGGTKGDDSDPNALGGRANDSIFEQREYDLRSLLYNIQKSKAEKDRAAVAERRTSMMTVEQLVEFLHEHNARDVCVIQVPPELDYVEYFVVCTAMGTRHVGRVADSLQAEVGYTYVRMYCYFTMGNINTLFLSWGNRSTTLGQVGDRSFVERLSSVLTMGGGNWDYILSFIQRLSSSEGLLSEVPTYENTWYNECITVIILS